MSAGWVTDAAAAAAAASAFLFLYRIRYKVANSAAIPTTPRPTPTPIPMAAPVGNPDDVSGDELPLDPASASPTVEWATPNPLKIVEVAEAEVGFGLVVEAADDVLVVDVVSRAMFHPTTAIAPTGDARVRVVVAIVHELGLPPDVDAKVKTAPDEISERQSPAMVPNSPFAREYSLVDCCQL